MASSVAAIAPFGQQLRSQPTASYSASLVEEDSFSLQAAIESPSLRGTGLSRLRLHLESGWRSLRNLCFRIDSPTHFIQLPRDVGGLSTHNILRLNYRNVSMHTTRQDAIVITERLTLFYHSAHWCESFYRVKLVEKDFPFLLRCFTKKT